MQHYFQVYEETMYWDFQEYANVRDGMSNGFFTLSFWSDCSDHNKKLREVSIFSKHIGFAYLQRHQHCRWQHLKLNYPISDASYSKKELIKSDQLNNDVWYSFGSANIATWDQLLLQPVFYQHQLFRFRILFFVLDKAHFNQRQKYSMRVGLISYCCSRKKREAF